MERLHRKYIKKPLVLAFEVIVQTHNWNCTFFNIVWSLKNVILVYTKILTSNRSYITPIYLIFFPIFFAGNPLLLEKPVKKKKFKTTARKMSLQLFIFQKRLLRQLHMKPIQNRDPPWKVTNLPLSLWKTPKQTKIVNFHTKIKVKSMP